MRLYITALACFMSVIVLGQEIIYLNQFENDEISSYATDVLELDESILLMLNYGVEMYRITYEMPFLDNQIEVSGAVFLPTSSTTVEEYPILVFNHGTTLVRTNAPSFKQEVNNMGYLLSSLGFIVLMPDYVGLGESQIMHPYCHAQSESDCGWQMVKAFVDSEEAFNTYQNGNLYISGYSQGGHVTMAMAKDPIPSSIEDEVTLKAVAPLSGPYNLSGVQLPLTFEDISYSNPAYLFYILKGWNSVYGDLYSNFSEICYEPYASIIEPMLNGEFSADDINDQCPDALTDIFPEELILGVLTDPNNIIMQHAVENDVYEWVPSIPMRINYCMQDEEVFYENALSAEDWMIENGAEDVIAYNLGNANHNTCAIPAIKMAILWFYSLDNSSSTSVWHPAVEVNTICTLYDLYGRIVYEGEVGSMPNLIGIYLIQYGPGTLTKKIFWVR
jgi:hypothetical protein